jgi:hypothetical protein
MDEKTAQLTLKNNIIDYDKSEYNLIVKVTLILIVII